MWSVTIASAITRNELDGMIACYELAEVTIEDESDRCERTWPHRCHVRDVYGLEPREHGDAICVLDRAVEWNGYAVQQNQIDLEMRHSEPLDHILRGSRALEAHLDGELPPRRRQEVV
jgi:hypothetical protein